MLALVQPRELISAAVLPQDGHSPFADVRSAKALPFFILYLTMRLSFRGPSSFSSAFRPVDRWPVRGTVGLYRRTSEQDVVVLNLVPRSRVGLPPGSTDLALSDGDDRPIRRDSGGGGLYPG